MMRWVDGALVALMVIAAGITFWIKHDTRRIADEIASLERRAEAHRAAIELAKADWSLLSQPDRLQELVDAHDGELALRTATPDQFVRLDQLGAELDRLAPGSVEDAIAAIVGADGVDTTATGSIR